MIQIAQSERIGVVSHVLTLKMKYILSVKQIEKRRKPV